jgi:surface polysaccharide O-acyltransferase-like enzyme
MPVRDRCPDPQRHVREQAKTEKAPRLERNATLDGLKYVAAAMIVLHHVSDYEAAGRLGTFLSTSAVTALFFFFALSGYLHGPVGGRGGAWRIERLKRLGIPYAVWSAVYLLWGERAALLHGTALVPLPNPFVLVFFAGAHGILWFLPMLLFCALASDLLIRDARSRRVAIALCAAVTLALIWSGMAAAVTDVTWHDFALASLWLLTYLGGMEVRAAKRLPKPSVRVAWVAAVPILGAGLLSVEASHFAPPLATTLVYAFLTAGALALVLGAASGFEWFGVARFAWGRDYLIGIYLSHVIWLSTLARLVPPAALVPAVWIPLVWALSFAGASLTTWAFLSFRITRPIVT